MQPWLYPPRKGTQQQDGSKGALHPDVAEMTENQQSIIFKYTTPMGIMFHDCCKGKLQTWMLIGVWIKMSQNLRLDKIKCTCSPIKMTKKNLQTPSHRLWTTGIQTAPFRFQGHGHQSWLVQMHLQSASRSCTDSSAKQVLGGKRA